MFSFWRYSNTAFEAVRYDCSARTPLPYIFLTMPMGTMPGRKPGMLALRLYSRSDFSTASP